MDIYLISQLRGKIRLRMQKRLFVAGLPFTSSEDELRDHFSGAGKLISVKIIVDRDSGRSKGFGFIEYETEEEAVKAIEMFHDTDFAGRKLAVAEAKPMENRERSFDNRGGGGDRRGGGGYHSGGDRGGDRRGGGRDRSSRGGFRGGR